MTETTTDAGVEPWVAVGPPVGGFIDQLRPGWLTPGQHLRWAREEARVRAEEQRKAEERAERADRRMELALWVARQHALAHGHKWNPERPFEYWPSVIDRANALFNLQDREARASDLAAAKEAGLVHLLHQGVSSAPREPELLEPPGPSGPATRGVPTMAPPETTTPAGKARAALRRWNARERRQRFEVNP